MKENKPRRHSRIFVIIAAALAVILGSAAVYAATTAGTDQDPVVTKSYVDNAIAAAQKDQDNGNTSGNESKGDSGNTSSADSGYQIIEMKAGEKITGYQNTEIIVRSGTVRTTIPSVSGISDLTAGKDLGNNVTITKDHLLLVPRSDGRGIVARTSAFVMIKGSYTLDSGK